MKNCITLLFVCFLGLNAFGWGATGHRTVGDIAENHLTRKAKKRMKALLGTESLAMVSTWLDEIRSDSTYDHVKPWHYVSIPDGQTYEASEKNAKGDVIEAINRLSKELADKELPAEKRIFALKALAHLIGDIHQPLHVGRKDDRGGNKVEVKWFGKKSNLHRVWDSGMIDSKGLSFSELSKHLDQAPKEQVKKWQSDSVLDWANESMSYRQQLYKVGKGRLGYRYSYEHWNTVELRLLQAGIRLAGIINQALG